MESLPRLNFTEYGLVKDFILENVTCDKPITFTKLLELAQERISHKLRLNSGWFVMMVKKDLEKQKIIKISISKKPRHLQTILLNKTQKKKKRSR